MSKPTFAETVKGGSFGKEVKDRQDSFELRLKAPGKSLQIADIIPAIKAKIVDPKEFFGLRREHQDLVASFHSKVERDLLLKQKSIKVKGVDISLSQYPPTHSPLSSGFRSVLLQVPMTATGSAIAKAIAPLSPLNFIIEKYRGTQVRTGRVILWTPSAPQATSVFINGTEVTMKPLEKLKKKETPDAAPTDSVSDPKKEKKEVKEATEEKKESADLKGAPSSSTATQEVTHARVPLMEADLDDPRTPPKPAKGKSPSKKRKLSPLKPTPITADIPKWTKATFMETGIPVPQNHSVLSIYENIKSRDDVVQTRKKVPSPLKNATNKLELDFERTDSSGLLDTLVFSTMTEEDPDYNAIEKIYYSLEPDLDYLFTSKGWLQKVFVTSTIVVLVIYKTRIADHQNSKKKNK